MNGHVCCILGVCCPPGSQEQIDALASELSVAHPDMEVPYAQKAAAWVLKNFDLAPAGSLSEFKREIAAVIRRRERGNA